MSVDRRLLLGGGAAVVVLALGGGYWAYQRNATDILTAPSSGDADRVSTADLMQASQLPDMVMGSENAPVTIVEYASMTCPHCARFTIETFPALKERYIDTGKVRFIFREFPLDSLAAGASLLARCGEKDKYFSLIDLLFNTQAQWAVQNPVEPLFNVVKQAGYSREAFNACLDTRNNVTARNILNGIESSHTYAIEKLKVNSTPTFFLNGKRLTGEMSIADIEKEILPYLKTS